MKRTIEAIGSRCANHPSWPGRDLRSTEEAGYTTAAVPLRLQRRCLTLDKREESIYALVGLLLDFRIRGITDNRRSFDDAMRLAWERFGASGVGYPEGALEQIAEEIVGTSLSTFFDAYLRSTTELNYAKELAAAGLALIPSQTHESKNPEVTLGVRLREDAGRPHVTHVLADTPAAQSGINAGDELVALNGLRITGNGLAARLAEKAPGERIRLTVFRRDELLTLDVTVQRPATSNLELKRVPHPTPLHEAIYRSWLYLDHLPERR